MRNPTLTKLLPLTASAVAMLGTASMAQAEVNGHSLTGNVGVTNNYVWRGFTQTNDAPGVSGGIDYAHESGFYLGTWISNVDFSDPDTAEADDPASRSEYEQDWYAGYSNSYQDLSYDVGYILWSYPLSDNADFGEVYVALGYSYLTLQANYTVNSQVEDEKGSGETFLEDDLYYKATLDVPVYKDFGVSATVGHYEYDDDEADSYNHYNLYLNKGNFSFGIEANDADGDFPATKESDDPRFVVSWGDNFDLL